jgi:hypothetical protein
MEARVLADFFDGRVDADRLAAELATAYGPMSGNVRPVVVTPTDGSVVVTKGGMLRVCDAVLSGDLDPALLEPIGDCLMLSNSFEFDSRDAEVLSTVAHYWGAPEICYPLDLHHAGAFREWILNGTDPLA